MKQELLPVIIVTGPTAVGKSGLVYSLPENTPVEIINCDSRQVYQHMKIGTAYPSEEELNKFRHHLFGFLSPTEYFSAGAFVRQAKELIQQIHDRGKIPLLCGGTFFYIRSLWDGLAEEPEIPPGLKDEVNGLPLVKVRESLYQLDPESFQRIEANNDQRNRRALLFSRAAGKPFSTFQKTGGIYDQYKFASFYLHRDRQHLYERINKRVEIMFSQGLVAETHRLLEMQFSPTAPGLNTIGYKEICSNLGSNINTNQLQQIIAQKTRNFAKRQLTWFRNEPRLKKIDFDLGYSHLSQNIESLRGCLKS